MFRQNAWIELVFGDQYALGQAILVVIREDSDFDLAQYFT